jgi:eukaryotic-like serine/threonine-protein kinase
MAHPALISRGDRPTISHDQVLRRMEGGGMGVVYEAEDLRRHRHIALKFLPEDVVGDLTALRRFERGAQAASALTQHLHHSRY